MKKRPLNRPRTYPSVRFAAAIAIGSLWYFCVPWGGQLFIWLGFVYLLVLVFFAVNDYRNLSDAQNCSVTRRMEPVLSLGENNPIWIEIEHNGELSLFVDVQDDAPIELPQVISRIKLKVLPHHRTHECYYVSPSERGDYVFDNLHVRYTTSIGLMTRQITIPSTTPVKVYPDVLQTKKHLLLMKDNRVTLMGLRRSKQIGHGQEFERLRDYVAGDTMRSVDWKATARRGNLVVKEYDVEQSQNMMIMIDLGRTMASRTEDAEGKLGLSKADLAINASVLLAHVAAQSDDRVGLFCFADSPIAYVPPGKGKSQSTILLDAMYALQPRIEESRYYENMLLLSQKQRKRSLVFLFTDLVDPESSQALISSISIIAKKHLVVCMALSDYELPSIIGAKPEKAKDIYTQTMALSIIKERKNALAQLAGLGVLTVDATPADLTISAVNKYLQVKREARI